MRWFLLTKSHSFQKFLSKMIIESGKLKCCALNNSTESGKLYTSLLYSLEGKKSSVNF